MSFFSLKNNLHQQQPYRDDIWTNKEINATSLFQNWNALQKRHCLENNCLRTTILLLTGWSSRVLEQNLRETMTPSETLKSKGNNKNTKIEQTNKSSDTFRWGRSFAVCQSLSSLIRVTRGNLIDIPSAVCVVDLLNSAPVISHTGDFWRKQTHQLCA